MLDVVQDPGGLVFHVGDSWREKTSEAQTFTFDLGGGERERERKGEESPLGWRAGDVEGDTYI